MRSDAQAQLLRGLGAEHVVNMTADDFLPSLIDAIAATNAFLAFDAVGGGNLDARCRSLDTLPVLLKSTGTVLTHPA